MFNADSNAGGLDVEHCVVGHSTDVASEPTKLDTVSHFSTSIIESEVTPPSSAASLLQPVQLTREHQGTPVTQSCQQSGANANYTADLVNSADVLVASGRLETSVPYLLVLDGQHLGRGSTCQLHRGHLYLYRQLHSPHWKGWHTTPPYAAQTQEVPGTVSGESCKADCLYIASGHDAEGIRNAIKADIAAAAVTNVRAVVFKMPTLAVSPAEREDEQYSDRDSYRGSEDGIHPSVPTFKDLADSLRCEHRAYGILQGPAETEDAISILPPRPLTLSLSCRADQTFVDQHWPDLWPLMAWPFHGVMVDAGVTMGDMMVYMRNHLAAVQGTTPSSRALAASHAQVAAAVNILLLGRSQGLVADLRRQADQKLRRMHDRGLVHRDLHPGNICVTFDDEGSRDGDAPDDGSAPAFHATMAEMKDSSSLANAASEVSAAEHTAYRIAHKRRRPESPLYESGQAREGAQTSCSSVRAVLTFLDMGESRYHQYGDLLLKRQNTDPVDAGNHASEGEDASKQSSLRALEYIYKCHLDVGVLSDRKNLEDSFALLEESLEAMDRAAIDPNSLYSERGHDA